MKQLYLVRHAKSSWKDSSLADWERPLNKRGRRDAPFMGQLLAKRGIDPDLLKSSSAVRALHTAWAFADALEFDRANIEITDKLYEASVHDLLEIVQGLDNWHQQVALFGHNYTYTFFANWYAQPSLDNVPTAAIVGLQFEVATWQEVTAENGKMILFDYPRRYFPKS